MYRTCRTTPTTKDPLYQTFRENKWTVSFDEDEKTVLDTHAIISNYSKPSDEFTGGHWGERKRENTQENPRTFKKKAIQAHECKTKKRVDPLEKF